MRYQFTEYAGLQGETYGDVQKLLLAKANILIG